MTADWKKTVDKETQQAIIEEVRRIAHHINPKIWIGIKFLSTYFNLRPGELLNIKEGDIDLRQGEILIPHPKEKCPKKVFLLAEDVELLRSLPTGLPDLYSPSPGCPVRKHGEEWRQATAA